MGFRETIIVTTDGDLIQHRDGSPLEVNSGVYTVKIVGRERDRFSLVCSHTALYRKF